MSTETRWDPAIRSLLDHMVKVEASDLYLTAGSPPVFRIEGVGYPAKTALTGEQIAQMAETLLTPAQREEFATKLELNIALSTTTGGRFRANFFRQRGSAGLVIRLVRTKIKTLQDLEMPTILADVMRSKRGLVLLVGGTGSGKSTTLAAMIDHRNRIDSGHIITIEDPVEFVHQHQQCIVTQREVGIDTLSYKDALKNTLRQAPDVILIGEIRTRETMQHAVTFAETGHLCLATLHANNANQALDRIQNFFPADARDQLWMDLSLNLKAMIAQQLIPTVDGQGRRAAVEILINTPLVSDIIRKGEVHALKELMERSTELGMQTFDQSLYQLYCDGVISYEHALSYADSQNNMRLMIKMGTQTGGLGRATGLAIDDTTENTGQFFGKRP